LSAFFIVSALFVHACDRIIGDDQEALDEAAAGPHEPDHFEKVAA